MSDLFERAVEGVPVLAILRGFAPERTVELCDAAWSAGVALVEVPIQDPPALRSLAAAVEAGRVRGREVGAGTVTTVERVRAAAALGAAFTVAPGYDRRVAAASRTHGMPHLPGVATATDVQRALADGHVWLKVFPASVLGPDWIRAMRGPFPEARFVATGGIERANAAGFLRAGASLVAVGQAVETFDRTWGIGETSVPQDSPTSDREQEPL